MKYALLVYTPERTPTSAARERGGGRDAAFEKAIARAGVKVGGETLGDASSATSVRVRNGKTLTTDGPSIRTGEQLGAFYILECPDLDEAMRYAAGIPAAAYGTIEVRPVQEAPGRGVIARASRYGSTP